MPVLSANQVTMWAALRGIGAHARRPVPGAAARSSPRRAGGAAGAAGAAEPAGRAGAVGAGTAAGGSGRARGGDPPAGAAPAAGTAAEEHGRMDMTDRRIPLPRAFRRGRLPAHRDALGASDIRLPVVHTDIGEDAHRVDALLEMGADDRLAERGRGAAAGRAPSPWSGPAPAAASCTAGRARTSRSRDLAGAAGLPASSTSFAFAHAIRALGAEAGRRRRDLSGGRRRALHGLPQGGRDRGGRATAAAGSSRRPRSAPGTGTRCWRWRRAGDHPDAEVVLLPDTALHTAAYLPDLEEALGKPVLTANQVTVWEGLRLADRRAWAPKLGTCSPAGICPGRAV